LSPHQARHGEAAGATTASARSLGPWVLALPVACLISIAWWRGDTVRQPGELCPDGYCPYLEKIDWAIRGDDAVASIQLFEFVRGYTHAHSPLGPLLGALLLPASSGPISAFALASLIATLGTWAGMSRSAAFAGRTAPSSGVLLLAFLGSPIVVRSIALWGTVGDARAVVGRVHGSWVVQYLVFVAVGGGALWPRYFLPIVPSNLLLAAGGLAVFQARRPALCRAVLLVFTLVGLLWCGAGGSVVAAVQLSRGVSP
jgi:hypothetical protein